MTSFSKKYLVLCAASAFVFISGYNYGITASWTLFNGGQNWFNFKTAQAVLAQNQLAVVNKWINVVSEVRQAQDNLVRAEADLASSRVNLENAKAQMEAAIGSR
jgi:outer membrane protein TolC